MIRNLLLIAATLAVASPALAFDPTQPSYTDQHGNVWQNNGPVTVFDTAADADYFLAQAEAAQANDPIETEPEPIPTLTDLEDELDPVVFDQGHEWVLVQKDTELAEQALSDIVYGVDHTTAPSPVDPSEEIDESAFPNRIFGTDNRFNARSNSFYPFRAQVAMSLESAVSSAISHRCSATMISPSVAITAAHCVHSGRRWLDPSRFRWGPGGDRRDGPNRTDWFPFGEFKCAQYVTTSKWHGGNRHTKHDWAFVDFGACGQANQVGNIVGWLGTHTGKNDDQRWFNFGYPGTSTTCAGANCLPPSIWGSSRTTNNSSRRNRIWNRIDATPGHSGSGVYFFNGPGDRRVVGLMAREGSGDNSGRRFNSSLFRFASRHTRFPQ